MPLPNFTLNWAFRILFNKWYPDPYPTTSFAGQTILITGSNTGLGLEAARHFVRLNAAKVILAVRSLQKGEAAKRNIERSTLRTNVIEVWKLDLGSFAGTMECVEKLQTLPRLDVAVMNAGCATGMFRMSPDGWEETLQVNVLSTTLLALHVLRKQISYKQQHPGELPPRLVVVASDGHGMTRFAERNEPNVLEVLNRREYFEKLVNTVERYPMSKLFIMYVVRELAKLVPMHAGDPAVVVNMVNPGFCWSELGRDLGAGYIIALILLAKSAEKGSRTIIDAAGRGKESHGKYLSYCRITKPEPVITSRSGKRAQKKIWDEVVGVLNEKYPGILELTLGE